eukprot:CAMPEP_0182442206 /NCGR_PEP_ID=MMETSP1172-20130603/1151_1 /TAXON_ID=708627 /ORGANISM="Timspurckia oligopyrenoides, Strain CCMP3278" /LENGTH=174 /DNA_ID=CAMNT_0024636941 /DNA_START=270 /DNA_END=794 /DNA_ORIENTATION=+
MAGAAFLLLDFATDPSKLQSMNSTVLNDPLTATNSNGTAVINAMVKLYIAAALSSLSFFAMTQNIRLLVHLGYFIRAAVQTGDPEDEEVYQNFRLDIIALTDRAGIYFLIGLRSFYLLIPTVAWILGPIYLLIVSILLLSLLYCSDMVQIPGLSLDYGYQSEHQKFEENLRESV